MLRRKVEGLESDKESMKKQVKELTEKVTSAANKTNANSALAARRNTTTTKGNNLADEKIKVCRKKVNIQNICYKQVNNNVFKQVLEDEIDELRKKLIEKERDCERLHAELSLAQKKPKGLIKSK